MEKDERKTIKQQSSISQSNVEIDSPDVKSIPAPPYQLKTIPITQRKGEADETSSPMGKSHFSQGSDGLPNDLRSGIESMSGFDMSDVKVNYNSSKPAQLQAHAYAQGSNIEIGPGQERHLPHEAWHVVQQKQGRVQPTTQLKGQVNVNDDAGLEREADIMGQKAVQSKSNVPLASNNSVDGTGNEAIVQRVEKNVTVTGISHMVEMDGKSLQNSTKTRAIRSGQQLIIDTDEKVRSRRGPNQEAISTQDPSKTNQEVDEVGAHDYVWYKVVSYKGKKVNKNYYVREDVYIETQNKLMDYGLEEPKSFLLDQQGIDNQKEVFSDLDDAFEAENITDGNKGVLNINVKLTPDGIDLEIGQGIRVGGAMVPFEGALLPDVQDKIKTLVEGVLKDSGQWDYLKANRHELINDDWSVMIDVDFYYARNKSQTNFHMDTTGETLFTNLIYNNFQSQNKFGPEVISNLSNLSNPEKQRLDQKVGGPQQFPANISEDVIDTRYRDNDHPDGKTLMNAFKIQPNNIVSFTDATSFHATPKLSERFGDDGTSDEQAYIFQDGYRFSPDTVERKMDEFLPEIEERKRQNGGNIPAAERRTFIRMWVQIMNTSFEQLNDDVLEMINVFSTTVPNTDIQDPTNAVYFLNGQSMFYTWFKKFSNRISATNIARRDEIGQNDKARQLIANLKILLNYFTQLIHNLTFDRSDDYQIEQKDKIEGFKMNIKDIILKLES